MISSILPSYIWGLNTRESHKKVHVPGKNYCETYPNNSLVQVKSSFDITRFRETTEIPKYDIRRGGSNVYNCIHMTHVMAYENLGFADH